MSAVYRLRSVAVAGPAGMGKSNMVRFIAAHAQVQQDHLGERAAQTAFVHVDCTGLLESDELELLGEMAAQLQRGGLAPAVSPFPAELRAARSALKEQLLAVPAERNLVLILDNLDEVAQKVGRTFFDYLCSLRNARPLRNVVYLFVTRRPLGPLHELQELFDDPVVVGPLGGDDARAMLEREAVRLGCTFAAAETDRLIACTGGHPGFLKNASEVLAGGRLKAIQPEEAWVQELLAAERIRLLGAELWADLTPPEQSLLRGSRRGPPPGTTRRPRGCCAAASCGSRAGPVHLCPPLCGVVRGQAAAPGPVRITAELPNRARIETPTGTQT